MSPITCRIGLTHLTSRITAISAAVANDGIVPDVESDSFGPFVRFVVDPAVYTDAAIFKAAYWFTGTFFVFIDRTPDSRIAVELRPKAGANVDTAVGEFRNALIDARVRQIVLAETGAARDELIKKAFQEGMPKPGFSNIRSNEAALSGSGR